LCNTLLHEDPKWTEIPSLTIQDRNDRMNSTEREPNRSRPPRPPAEVIRWDPQDPLPLALPHVRVHAAGYGRTDVAKSAAAPIRPIWRAWWGSARGVIIRHEGRQIPLRPDRVLVISPGTPITRQVTRAVDHLWVHFSAGHPYDRLEGRVFQQPIDPDTRARSAHLAALLERRGRVTAFDYRDAIHLHAVVADILLHVPRTAWPIVHHDPRIWTVIRFMEQHRGTPLANDELAGMAGMSTSVFIRTFSRQTRQPPQAFWQTLRLQRAGILLHHSNRTLPEIAEECGFCNRYYLSKCFKRRYGISPVAFRRAGAQA